MEGDTFPPGIKLTRNDLGGLAVTWNGKFIGWIHASIGDRWNAYARRQAVRARPAHRPVHQKRGRTAHRH